MTIEKIMVVGAGQMGAGIAQVAAQTGLSVILNDIDLPSAEKGMSVIGKSLSRAVAKGKLTEAEKEATISRIALSENVADAGQCQLVVEAIVESMEVKGQLFKRLDELCPDETILASNTSSLPITEIAAFTNRADRVIGMHFMNPVPVMTLVEVIRGLATSNDVYAKIEALSQRMGKHPVEVRDMPGFISNRVLQVMINEAVFCLYEGIATPEGIDEVMMRGMNHPMGPLTLADFIGLDTVLYILETLHSGFGDPKYRPCPLLRQYVKAGRLGRKSGQGFYNYAEGGG